MSVKSLGSHVVAELSHCCPEVLADLERVQQAMVVAAVEAGATVREVAFHKFEPHGVSGVVVLSESHLSIHTWPEHGYAAIDVYTCGGHTHPRRACEFLAAAFRSRSVNITTLERGIPTGFGSYDHRISSSERGPWLRSVPA